MGPRTEIQDIASGLFAEVSGQIADVLLGVEGTAPSGKDLEQRLLDLVLGDLPVILVDHDIDTELAVVVMGVQGVVVTGQGLLNIRKEFDLFV